MTRAAWLSLALAACSDWRAEPNHGAMFGQYEVEFTGDFSALGPIHDLEVGGIKAYAVSSTTRAIHATLQGAPLAGDADVSLHGAMRSRTVAHGFHYDLAKNFPAKWAAFGASLTQGVQSNGIDSHSQIFGVSGQIGRAAGAYLGLPLFSDGLVPPDSSDTIAADCSTLGLQSPSVQTIVVALTDASGMIDLTRARIDASLVTRNFAVGGSRLHDIMRGADQPVALLEHIVEDTQPSLETFFNPLTESQIDRLVSLDPDVAFCTDLLGNDAALAVIGSDVAADRMTALADVEPLLAELGARLGALHGQFFIANVFRMTLLPNVARLQLTRGDAPDVFAAKVAAVDAAVLAYNQALADAFATYANIHLVDAYALSEAVAAGVDVGGEHLTLAHLGGLLSLDDFHFTDTGYALYANLFLDRMRDVLSEPLPAIDAAQVHATDALAPRVLRTAHPCVP